PYKRIARNATKSGNMKHCVILMHDMRTKTTTVKALPKIIKYYKKHGYAFRKLSKSSFQAHQHINN
ncbi:MAG TPA: polysaccharide deacetylase, partial [Kandleria vitulina]|nr:polysaccharide deacetylase [Kandleria vitulina]